MICLQAALNAYVCVRCKGSWACTVILKNTVNHQLEEHKCLDCNYSSLPTQEVITAEDSALHFLNTCK